MMRMLARFALAIGLACLLLAGCLLGYRQLVFARYKPFIDAHVGHSVYTDDGLPEAYHPCIARELAPRLITQIVDDPATLRDSIARSKVEAAARAGREVKTRLNVERLDFDKESRIGWHLRAWIWSWLLRAEYSEAELSSLHDEFADGRDCRKDPWK